MSKTAHQVPKKPLNNEPQGLPMFSHDYLHFPIISFRVLSMPLMDEDMEQGKDLGFGRGHSNPKTLKPLVKEMVGCL